MLSTSAFTIGNIGQATPLTLVLPRNRYEETILIGWCSNGPAALFLSGTNQFDWFESAKNDSWHGLLIPKVYIEVDETSVFDPRQFESKPGTVVRKGTQLIAQANQSSGRSFRKLASVVLEDELPLISEEEAGFLRWQIVIGSRREKRVLHEISIGRD
ncbi:MAG: hypothetical protein ACYC0F_04750 [Rhodanobacter sp.]